MEKDRNPPFHSQISSYRSLEVKLDGKKYDLKADLNPKAFFVGYFTLFSSKLKTLEQKALLLFRKRPVVLDPCQRLRWIQHLQRERWDNQEGPNKTLEEVGTGFARFARFCLFFLGGWVGV